MELRVDGVYRSRDGRKATILENDGTDIPFWVDYGNDKHYLYPDGTASNGGPGVGIDLIAEWSEPATPDADGWITWAGGECPVPGDTVVETRWNDPNDPNDRRVADRAIYWKWDRDPERVGEHGAYIVAYRIVNVDKNPIPPLAPDADGWIAHVPGAPQPFEDMQMVEWDNGKRTGRMIAGDLMWDVGTSIKRYRAALPIVPEMPVTMHTPAISAPAILDAAAGHMRDRAATYDVPTGERSMARTVAVFNALHGLALTEAQGWSFMACLKHVRAFQSGRFHGDSVEDMAAYVSLMGEAQARAEGGAS